jgi:hypothetical protein
LEQWGGPVSRLLSSPRRRRRLVRLAIVAVLAVVAAVTGIWFANTGKPVPNTFDSRPVRLPGPAPQRAALSARDRDAARAVAARFIDAAVLRKNSDDSWDVTAPVLRQGFTRQRWGSGEIPVVPYPANAVLAIKYRLEFSEQDQLWLKVALVPKPSSSIDGQLFSMGLQRTKSTAHPWLVDYWTPAGIGSPNSRTAAARYGTPTPKSSVNGNWIIAPIAVLAGLILCVPLCLAGRGWYRTARANRTYRQTS